MSASQAIRALFLVALQASSVRALAVRRSAVESSARRGVVALHPATAFARRKIIMLLPATAFAPTPTSAVSPDGLEFKEQGGVQYADVSPGRGDADAVERGDAENAGTPTSRASSGANEDRVGQIARLRETARARFSKAGRAVAMGLRAANALEDASAEGRAARRAEREASAATEAAAKAQHALSEATRSSTLAKRALDAANEALAEAEARAPDDDVDRTSRRRVSPDL